MSLKKEFTRVKTGAKEKMHNLIERHEGAIIKVQTSLMIMQLMIMNASATGGQDIFERGKNLMKTLYTSIAGISSVTAGCVAAVCLYLMFFSKSQRTVDESMQWLKRIVICWLAIMLMSSIIYFVTTKLGIGTTATLN